ncbi:acyltransferase [Siphonobacter sp. BAB-5385]|uniref:acyltransferase family protein n=1 Tax=Siphonobacter sp. BAB-5385 TaxID=1864822 RepID=UPI000B9EC279|nr:acyltransferase family protein [Siphonobacter sp. BAB-5385]OZI10097.1 acyltransferase [Siphonobacter sp. BAB-5385]
MKILRRYDLDWLRVLAFGLLILFHTGMFFNYWDWHVKNNVQNYLIEYPMQFVGAWRMALLFMIAGMGVWLSLGQRSVLEFLSERTRRILLPLIFGMFVIVPPQIYVERLTDGATFSYLEFYRTVFHFQSYPKGNFGWHHLWFLAYLFSYNLVSIPLLGAVRKPVNERFTAAWARFCAHPGWLILVPTVWYALADFLWQEEFLNLNALCSYGQRHWYYLSFFLMGYFVCAQRKFWDTVVHYRFLTLALMVVSTTLLYTFFWIDRPELTGWVLAVYTLLRTFHTWVCLLTLFGNAHYYLNFNSRFLSYANEAVCPFYILHQLIIVVVGYWLAPLQMNWPMKFILLVVSTFLTCWVLYHFLIRHLAWTRLLFGLKPKAVRVASPLESLTP